MKNIFRHAALLVLNFFFLYTSFSQDSAVSSKHATTANATTALVASKHFVFVPETVSPMRGSTRPVNGPYELVISGDTITSNLPYFGRSFSAPANPADSPLRFTATGVEITTRERSKGGWDIVLKPGRNTNVQQMNLFVSDNGFASLQVSSTNRQPISFSGHVDELGRGK